VSSTVSLTRVAFIGKTCWHEHLQFSQVDRWMGKSKYGCSGPKSVWCHRKISMNNYCKTTFKLGLISVIVFLKILACGINSRLWLELQLNWDGSDIPTNLFWGGGGTYGTSSDTVTHQYKNDLKTTEEAKIPNALAPPLHSFVSTSEFTIFISLLLCLTDLYSC
jgi:hypothetical protein